jgi:antitoxin component YwqK of YwqJK toxin-antitoxin module
LNRHIFKYLFLIFSIIALIVNLHAQNPVPDGAFSTHHLNGKLSQRGRYKDGLRIGIWMYYDNTGLILKKERWKRDVLQWESHYIKGRVVKIIDKKGRVRHRPECGC